MRPLKLKISDGTGGTQAGCPVDLQHEVMLNENLTICGTINLLVFCWIGATRRSMVEVYRRVQQSKL
jgi:hypothetical protein